MTYIEFNIEDAPEWIKGYNKDSMTNCTLVNCRGESVLSETTIMMIVHDSYIDDFVETLSHLSMTHLLVSYQLDCIKRATKLAFQPSLDGTTNIDAKMISDLAMSLFNKKI